MWINPVVNGKLGPDMPSPDPIEAFQMQMGELSDFIPDDWEDVSGLLEQLRQAEKSPIILDCDNILEAFAGGAAFLTYSFGIDGVSIEIAKYASALSDLLAPTGKAPIHLIAGSFSPEVDSILDPAWKRLRIQGIDGWDKWDEGKWFEGLFKRKMKSGSEESSFLAKEIFRQAAAIARRLGDYLLGNRISLLVPVNVASNPGNMALTLGLVIATELLGTYVLNNNHDFYWEAGRPESERDPEEPPGVRDHFFRNMRNRSYFSLFESLYPWKGDRWMQVNINARQSRKLVDRFGFPERRVREITTYVPDACFDVSSKEDKVHSRVRMAHILSDGEAIMCPVSIEDHLANISAWMQDQQPIIVGARSGLAVDPSSEDLLIVLQPTRIVGRKRIDWNVALLRALLQRSALKNEFEDNPRRQLILHITGPTPREHQADLEKILRSFRKTVRALRDPLAKRIFISFSVGRESHASFAIKQFQPLTIEAIYRMADMVVFPSETEGRGLPIVEASACGIPIVCSHYMHREVFSDVIGEDLPDRYQIRHTLFPEVRFPRSFLSKVAALLMHPADHQDDITHNREAVRARYSQAAFKSSFQHLLEQLCSVD